MHLRIAIAAVAIGLAGCNIRPDGFPHAHIQVERGAQGREQVYQIGKQLSGFAPLILLEEERGIANIALTERAPNKVISQAAKRVNARVTLGLDRPTAAFIQQIRCAADRRCDVAADMACEFAAEVSPEQYARYFADYAHRLSYGGYAVLAVLYKKDNPDKVTIHVPMYDNCQSGAQELEKAWKVVSSDESLTFVKTSTVRSGPDASGKAATTNIADTISN